MLTILVNSQHAISLGTIRLTLAEVQDFIDSLPSKEKANANLVLMFTLNACHKIVNDEILSKEVFAQ